MSPVMRTTASGPVGFGRKTCTRFMRDSAPPLFFIKKPGAIYDYNTLYYNGTFGSLDAKHYVYTSSMQSRFVEEGQVEGIGITPTKVVYQAEDGYLGAMNKAIDYIKGY